MNDSTFAWPPQVATGSEMPRIEAGIDIARPPVRVFEYVATPALWPTWHPATASVREVPNRPLLTGETMIEGIRAVGRRFEARWTVLAWESPGLWVIAAATTNGDARIVYRIAPARDGCRFQRTLEYRSHHWPWRALDANVTHWLLGWQSRRALTNLKRVLEGAT